MALAMDTLQLRQLVEAAVQSGVCSPAVQESLRGQFSLDDGEVSRSSMLRIYERRLSRVPEGSELHGDTRRLVEFLRNSPLDSLRMIGVRSEKGGFQLLLADPEGTAVLFWMKMFSRP
ncbi:hypothetical protein ABT034_03490 [Streptomyces sp. NPDC002773]|uniref:hypothetical protein n=1 Tax=Streptomyces sp. NPDC002773 TaxID=3154430 RepID=UPI003330B958